MIRIVYSLILPYDAEVNGSVNNTLEGDSSQ
jgi:hypothetical protein